VQSWRARPSDLVLGASLACQNRRIFGLTWEDNLDAVGRQDGGMTWGRRDGNFDSVCFGLEFGGSR
jgi:hypothetical protein